MITERLDLLAQEPVDVQELGVVSVHGILLFPKSMALGCPPETLDTLRVEETRKDIA